MTRPGSWPAPVSQARTMSWSTKNPATSLRSTRSWSTGKSHYHRRRQEPPRLRGRPHRLERQCRASRPDGLWKSGAEVLGTDVVEELAKLTHQFLGTGRLAVFFLVLGRKKDPLGLHQVVGHI